MKSRKKGFTIAEIVIALAIIALLSLAATSLVLTSQSVQKKSRDKFFAANLCNNSISVFQSAANDSASLNEMYGLFQSKIGSLLSIDMPNLEDTEEKTATIYFDGGWMQLSDTEGAKFKCELSFKEGGIANANTVIFEIKVDKINDDNIYSTSYLMAFGGQQ